MPRTGPCNIALTAGNAAAIEAHLAGVNGRASAFTIKSFHQVCAIAAAAKADLAANFPSLGADVDLVIEYRRAGPSANSYRYAATTTEVFVARQGGAWHYIGANRSKLDPKTPVRVRYLVDGSAAKLLAKAAKGKRPLQRIILLSGGEAAA